MSKQEMTLDQFLSETEGGKIFTVEFWKRTNGERRTMNCRRGVTKGVKGVGMAYNPAERNLLTVYDLQKLEEGKSEKGAYRMVNLSDLISLKWQGKIWNWDEQKKAFVEA